MRLFISGHYKNLAANLVEIFDKMTVFQKLYIYRALLKIQFVIAGLTRNDGSIKTVFLEVPFCLSA